MADYTSAAEIEALAGQVGVDLRSDDAAESALLDDAVAFAGGEVDFAAQGRWSNLAGVQWVRNCATHLATEWLCLRRLNTVPSSLEKRCDGYRQKLEKVEDGRLVIPGATRGRRPVTVTNQHVDLRKFNNQVGTDVSRSTGVAGGYRRVTDDTAPDQR